MDADKFQGMNQKEFIHFFNETEQFALLPPKADGVILWAVLIFLVAPFEFVLTALCIKAGMNAVGIVLFVLALGFPALILLIKGSTAYRFVLNHKNLTVENKIWRTKRVFAWERIADLSVVDRYMGTSVIALNLLAEILTGWYCTLYPTASQGTGFLMINYNLPDGRQRLFRYQNYTPNMPYELEQIFSWWKAAALSKIDQKPTNS